MLVKIYGGFKQKLYVLHFLVLHNFGLEPFMLMDLLHA